MNQSKSQVKTIFGQSVFNSMNSPMSQSIFKKKEQQQIPIQIQNYTQQIKENINESKTESLDEQQLDDDNVDIKDEESIEHESDNTIVSDQQNDDGFDIFVKANQLDDENGVQETQIVNEQKEQSEDDFSMFQKANDITDSIQQQTEDTFNIFVKAIDIVSQQINANTNIQDKQIQQQQDLENNSSVQYQNNTQQSQKIKQLTIQEKILQHEQNLALQLDKQSRSRSVSNITPFDILSEQKQQTQQNIFNQLSNEEQNKLKTLKQLFILSDNQQNNKGNETDKQYIQYLQKLLNSNKIEYRQQINNQNYQQLLQQKYSQLYTAELQSVYETMNIFIHKMSRKNYENIINDEDLGDNLIEWYKQSFKYYENNIEKGDIKKIRNQQLQIQYYYQDQCYKNLLNIQQIEANQYYFSQFQHDLFKQLNFTSFCQLKHQQATQIQKSKLLDQKLLHQVQQYQNKDLGLIYFTYDIEEQMNDIIQQNVFNKNLLEQLEQLKQLFIQYNSQMFFNYKILYKIMCGIGLDIEQKQFILICKQIIIKHIYCLKNINIPILLVDLQNTILLLTKLLDITFISSIVRQDISAATNSFILQVLQVKDNKALLTDGFNVVQGRINGVKVNVLDQILFCMPQIHNSHEQAEYIEEQNLDQMYFIINGSNCEIISYQQLEILGLARQKIQLPQKQNQIYSCIYCLFQDNLLCKVIFIKDLLEKKQNIPVYYLRLKQLNNIERQLLHIFNYHTQNGFIMYQIAIMFDQQDKNVLQELKQYSNQQQYNDNMYIYISNHEFVQISDTSTNYILQSKQCQNNSCPICILLKQDDQILFLLQKDKVNQNLEQKIQLQTFLLDRDMFYNNKVTYKQINFIKNVSKVL